MIAVNPKENETILTNESIYVKDIKNRLLLCKTTEDYIKAYKDVAMECIELMCDSLALEQRLINGLGKEKALEYIYGSKEEAEKQINLDKKLEKASSEEERTKILISEILNDTNDTGSNYPNPWAENEKEAEEYER